MPCRPSYVPKRVQHHTSGAALVEWLLAGSVLMLCGALAWELTQWHVSRQIALLALSEAARTGSVSHAHPRRMEQAFLQTLQVRYITASARNSQAHMLSAFAAMTRRSGQSAWSLTQRHPDETDFARWHEPGLSVSGAPGRRVIPHDRTERIAAEQWLFREGSAGAGPPTHRPPPLTLVLDARVHHPVATPLARGALTAAAAFHPDADTASAWRAGLVEIQLSTQIEMHSHAVQWPAEAGKTVRPGSHGTGTRVLGGTGPFGQAGAVWPMTRGPAGAVWPEIRRPAPDPLCGTVLCCL